MRFSFGMKCLIPLVRANCSWICERYQLPRRIVLLRDWDAGVWVDNSQQFAGHHTFDDQVLFIHGDNAVVFFEDRHRLLHDSD